MTPPEKNQYSVSSHQHSSTGSDAESLSSATSVAVSQCDRDTSVHQDMEDLGNIEKPPALSSKTQESKAGGSNTPTPGESEPSTDEAAEAFPKPGSPTSEVFAWWGRRLLERSRKFAAQQKEQALRESLARLKKSVPSLSVSEHGFENGPVLAACLYILIPCPGCSEVRQAIGDYPEQAAVACPVCRLECEFVALGVGLTSRPVPFHELHNGISEDAEGNARIPWDEMPRRKKVDEDG
jgi:hypothetical protein